MNAETCFTAERIGRCLGCRPQYARKMLKGVAPDEYVAVRGVRTASWSYSLFPSPIIAKLAKLAQQYGCLTPLQFLQNPPARSVTALRLKGRTPKVISRGQKLMQVFESFSNLSPDAPDSERARIAAPEFMRIFGYSVSDRYLRGKIAEVRENAGGSLSLNRLEFFLPRRVGKSCVRTSLDDGLRFEELDEELKRIGDRRQTLSEIAECWRVIVSMINDRLANDVNEITLKQKLRKYIVRVAPFLGANEVAVKRTLNRKILEAIENGGTSEIRDGRVEPKPRLDLVKQFEADVKLCARHATFFRGKRESQAYRELHQGTTHNGERFSEEFRAAYPFDVRRRKSQIPKWFRSAVQPMVRAMWPHRLGPRAARLALPSIHRDWSEVLAGDVYTSDDATLNHYVVDWHDKGEYEFGGRRFNVVRPQFLPVVDERTGNPLGFSLIPGRTYNSWAIKTLMARIAMRPEIGLPFKGWLFELAIWKARNVEALANWSQINESFERYGVRLSVRHATTPRAKVIEQIIGALQNLDEYAPGYIGRGEQLVKFERAQSFLQQLKRVGQPRKAEVDPCEMLMTMSECEEMIVNVMRRFAYDEPQNGERLDGLSPAEAWSQLSAGRPHTVLPESLRFLLSTAESIQKVTSEGVVLRIGRIKHYYCGSEKLGALQGEKVRVRFNPELPEQIVVSHIATDPHSVKPFAVPLFQRVRAHGAKNDEFDRAREHQNRFASYGRALYRELAPKSNLTVCHSQIGSPELRAAGEEHNRLEREHIELSSCREARGGKIRKLAARLNLGVDPKASKRPDRVEKHLQSACELEERITEMERKSALQEETVE